MKNARFSLWLAAAFLAGGVASWLLAVPPAWAGTQAQQAQKKVTWRYSCEYKEKEHLANFVAGLNKAGDQGWELVTVDSEGLYCMRMLK